MLEVAQLSAAYGKHHALNGVALTARPGEIVTMLGANGAGKSTLLKTIAGLKTPLPGASIGFAGHDLIKLQAHDIVEIGIALVPEGRGIFADLTVRENLFLLRGVPAPARPLLSPACLRCSRTSPNGFARLSAP